MFRSSLAVTLAVCCVPAHATLRAQETPKPSTEAPVASSGSTEQSEVPQVPGISGLLKGLTNAYEQLPIGDQKIYQSVVTGKTTTLVVSGHSVTEDNGFTSSLDIPIDAHTTLSTYYNRSLRLRDDVVSIGLTYVLRGSKPAKQLSDADLIRSLQEPDPAPPPAPKPTVPPPPHP